MKSHTIQLPVLIIVGLLIAGGSFYGGMLYGKSTSKASSDFASMRNQTGSMPIGSARRIGANGSGGMVTGEVLSKSDTGFTIKLRDGGSKIVLVSDSTTIGKMAEGTAEDLTEGTGIVVTGTTNSDGSITASTVQIRPSANQVPGFGGPGGDMTPPEGMPTDEAGNR